MHQTKQGETVEYQNTETPSIYMHSLLGFCVNSLAIYKDNLGMKLRDDVFVLCNINKRRFGPVPVVVA